MKNLTKSNKIKNFNLWINWLKKQQFVAFVQPTFSNILVTQNNFFYMKRKIYPYFLTLLKNGFLIKNYTKGLAIFNYTLDIFLTEILSSLLKNNDFNLLFVSNLINDNQLNLYSYSQLQYKQLNLSKFNLIVNLYKNLQLLLCNLLFNFVKIVKIGKICYINSIKSSI